jgi:acyl-CoA synthetase (NDP forming)
MHSGPNTLAQALDPATVAIIGASDSPDKVGGRPLMYLSRFGYRGRIYPVNAHRRQVQGHRAYPAVADLPEAPDLAVIALPADAAVTAVEECAMRGARVAIVMSSGFAETGEHGQRREARVLAAARTTGMRVVGPNSQGLVNFGTGTVATFSTMFLEVEPADGPVAIVSQSGIMSVVPYALLRQRGIGVRHSHATGNSSDVTLAELAWAVLQDAEVKLLLLYLEALPDPPALARVAALARERDIPIVAVKSGRSAAGQAAALSHTASLASEDRIVDAFFRQHGIVRAADMHGLVNAAELYLKGWKPRGRRLAVVANSGATCVMAADSAARLDLPLATFGTDTVATLSARLPAFARAANPLDVTGALLTDSALLGDTLATAASDPDVDVLFLGLPVAGQGYDLERFASDTTRVIDRTGKPIVAATSVESVAARLRASGVPTFDRDVSALEALSQLCEHVRLRHRTRRAPLEHIDVRLSSGNSRFLSEAESLAFLASASLPIVPWRLCRTEDEVRRAFRTLGGAPIVAKGCSADVPHKSDHGLVVLDVTTEAGSIEAFHQLAQKMAAMRIRFDGVIIAAMAKSCHELAVGARIDPGFGPVVMIGAGGKYVEALDDIELLLPPFDRADVADALQRLRIAPLLRGVRGEPPRDIESVCDIATALGRLIVSGAGLVASIDVNPVMVGAVGQGSLIVDASVERCASPKLAK